MNLEEFALWGFGAWRYPGVHLVVVSISLYFFFLLESLFDTNNDDL